jgi:hypothetical protein
VCLQSRLGRTVSAPFALSLVSAIHSNREHVPMTMFLTHSTKSSLSCKEVIVSVRLKMESTNSPCIRTAMLKNTMTCNDRIYEG